MDRKDVVTLDIMKVLNQMQVEKDKYITWSSNNPEQALSLASENVQPSQKQ